MTNFPSSTAGSLLTLNVPTASIEATVSQILTGIRKKHPFFDTLSYVYIICGSGKLKGVCSISSLLKAKDSQSIKDIMTTELITVHPYTDQEKVAILAIQNNIKAIPVVDKNQHFMGIVTTDQIMNILHKEHIEDILKLSGLNVDVLSSGTTKKKTTSSLRIRLPWLLLGLVGSLFSTWIVSQFNHTIQGLLALTFFMPLVVYLSGAIANQTLSMLIRNLLITDLDIFTFYTKELTSGVILGALFGIIVGTLSFLWLGIPQISLIVAISLTITTAVSTTVSTLVPWILSKNHKDPALAAGPFAIILQDTLSLLIYFTIATIILNIY